MSKEEKKNAVPVEGSVDGTPVAEKKEEETTKKKPLTQRIKENPKAMKWLKRIGKVLGVGATFGLGLACGYAAAGRDKEEPEGEVVQPKLESKDRDDPEETEYTEF